MRRKKAVGERQIRAIADERPKRDRSYRSLDVTSTQEALSTAEAALRAGVDWLEAGTPLVLGEGSHAVRALRERFPETTTVADIKVMDGGYLETEMTAEAGATHVVVMARACDETIRLVVEAGHEFGGQGHGRQSRVPRPGGGRNTIGGP